VGAQTLPHDGRLSRSRVIKPTTFETLTGQTDFFLAERCVGGVGHEGSPFSILSGFLAQRMLQHSKRTSTYVSSSERVHLLGSQHRSSRVMYRLTPIQGWQYLQRTVGPQSPMRVTSNSVLAAIPRAPSAQLKYLIQGGAIILPHTRALIPKVSAKPSNNTVCR
jgi:hypothetical protein